jgi:hypothetical protein
MLMLFGMLRYRADANGTSREGAPGCVHTARDGTTRSPRR